MYLRVGVQPAGTIHSLKLLCVLYTLHVHICLHTSLHTYDMVPLKQFGLIGLWCCKTFSPQRISHTCYYCSWAYMYVHVCSSQSQEQMGNMHMPLSGHYPTPDTCSTIMWLLFNHYCRDGTVPWMPLVHEHDENSGIHHRTNSRNIPNKIRGNL